MGVVNPKRRIEEYIDDGIEIAFFDRFYNWEVAAGSYIVKNTQWTQKFLKGFADYEFRLPKNYHGTDNGALHVSGFPEIYFFFGGRTYYASTLLYIRTRSTSSEVKREKKGKFANLSSLEF
ncbi:hypothetical protein ANCCAN_14582 [Ancylostoma caninum]|uniref:Uncharacterized protein n=1 Tax=Ancylostoma caninum TaxID=29170 RepID=A0A368G8Z2_ANCCA|nr:hypothetical protein ANCCAN_14582 [Ancylostoma caninum]